MKALDPDARVIVASGYAPDAEELGGSPAGFIGKPYEMREILDKVCGVVAGA